MEGLYCLTVEGGPLTDPMRNLLFDTAQEMMEKSDEVRIIRTSVGEGEIRTSGEQGVVGGMCGTIFNADLDTNHGSFSVAYMVRPTQTFKAKDGYWS